MIIKNGEILAIDHIAHDNTLSGNGTSAKPVGLSQSTKDLIDSKVKKTDFETYKSSAANQISNINTKITTDESNFESYKSSAHNEIANFKSSAHDEIARVDASIAAVNAAKVNNTTFEQYQTDVTNNFTAVNKRIDDVNAAKVDNTTFDNFKGSANGELTGIKQSITDLDNAKQAKGDYVSASDFNNLKSSAHDEIERIDGRIDTTNTNLTNNYYTKDEVDTEISKVGAYEYVALDPNTGKPAVDNPSTKIIYLTDSSTPGLCLQWIYTLSNVWKCVGETTVDLDDYAKIVDVNAQFESTSAWANGKFETISDFNTVIAGYYTKGQVDTELENIAQEFVNTSAWANNTFATKTDLAGDKAELEGEINNLESKIEQDINNASADIINKIDTTSAYLDDKIEAVINTLEDDYYTSEQIDTILAASGEYYTKAESDTKYTEKEVFNTAINELSSNKLDKSATANWDVTEYTEGENIKIVDHEISGKDWSSEIAAAVENKVDESELENYYTSSQIDGNFVTKTEFNELDNEVGAIDADLDILSGKTVTVIKDSETVKAIRSTEPDGTISYTLSAHDGKQADYLWKPTVNAAGDISWELALTGDIPDPANIKGPQGIQGISGTPGKNGENGITPKLKIDENDIWNVSYDNEETWTSLGVSATGPKGEIGAQGPQGISGTPGKNGENGITPHIGNNNHWFIGDDDTGISATGPQGPAGTNGTNGKDGVSPTVITATIEGGNRVTFTYGEGSTEYIDVMSGIPGLPGVSPTVTVTNIPANPSDPDHKNGGTEITITDATSTNKFSAWNGNDGTMAGAPDIEGKNGISAVLAGSTYEVGLSGEFYKAVTSVSAKLDASVAASTYATKDALDDYLTKNDAAEAYQPKGEYLSANALNGYATEAWVEEQGYLTQNDIAGKADKTDLQYVSAGIDYVSGHIPSLNGYATEQYVQGASAEVTAWVNSQGYLTSIPESYATKTYVNEASANAYDKAVAQIPDVTNFITKDVNNLTYYYKTTETSGKTELSAEFAKIYYKSDSDDRYMQKNTDSTLSGDGTTNSPLGIDSDNFYEFDTVGNYLTSQTSNQKTLIGTTPALDNAVQKVIDEADTWDTVSAKSVVTINKATNEIKINNNSNSAISATIYDVCNTTEPTLISQRLIVGTSSGDFVTYVNGGKCNGQGTLFFWLESMQPWVPVNN